MISAPLILPYPPSVNHYLVKQGRKWVLSPAALAYRQEAGYALNLAGVTRLEGNLRVCVHLYRPRKIGDADNTLKCLLDSANGIAWQDDEQIVELHVFRKDDRKNPRVELWIEVL